MGAPLPVIESNAEIILERILEHRNVRAGNSPVETVQERSHHLRLIQESIDRGEPVRLILPAFPAKSPNPEKTLGPLPDMGEVEALRHLDDLCRSVEAFHPAGAEVIICSDGRVFSDLVRVPDGAVSEYSRGIRKILGDFGFNRLTTFDLDDVLPGVDFSTMRRRLVGDHGESLDHIRRRLLRDEEGRGLFNGIHRFLFEDSLVLDNGTSRNQIRERTKKTAYEVIQRSDAWSRLLESVFPRAVRLSIHPQPLGSRKIGIRLLPGDDPWSTPWHRVAVRTAKGFRLMRRLEAERLGARRSWSPEGYGFFVLEEAHA